MRGSNCSEPIPIPNPGQPQDQKKYVCDKKGPGTGKWSEKKGKALQNEGIKVIE